MDLKYFSKTIDLFWPFKILGENLNLLAYNNENKLSVECNIFTNVVKELINTNVTHF